MHCLLAAPAWLARMLAWGTLLSAEKGRGDEELGMAPFQCVIIRAEKSLRGLSSGRCSSDGCEIA